MRALCSGLSAHADFAALTRQAQLVRFIRHRARTVAGLIKDPRGSLPVVWVTSRHGNAKRPLSGATVNSRARTNRTRGVPARRKCIAEVGGRRCGPEKRRRSAPLTRRSGVCVAGGLARSMRLSIVHGETWGQLDWQTSERSNVESRIAAAKSRDRPKKASNLRTQSPIDGRHLGLWTSCDLHGRAVNAILAALMTTHACESATGKMQGGDRGARGTVGRLVGQVFTR